MTMLFVLNLKDCTKFKRLLDLIYKTTSLNHAPRPLNHGLTRKVLLFKFMFTATGVSILRDYVICGSITSQSTKCKKDIPQWDINIS